MIDKHFKLILDNSSESIVFIGTNHEVLAFNKKLRDVLYQYYNKEIKEGDLYYPDFVIEANQKFYLQGFDSAINGTPFSIQYLSKVENVSYWFEYKMMPIYEDGKLFGVTQSIKDITREKVAEQKIIDFSEKLQAFLDNTDESITLLDMHSKIMFMNQTALKTITHNTGGDNFIGEDFRDFIPDKNNLFYKYFPIALHGENTVIDVSYLNTLGETIWYQTKFNSVYDQSGKQIGVSIFAKDISNQKALEKSLQDSEEKFRKISELMPVGVLLSDDNFKINYSNIAAREIFQYSEVEIKELCISNVFEGFSISESGKLKIDDLVIDNPFFSQEKLIGLTKINEKKQLLLSSSSFFIQENQHFIFIVQDITSINQKDNIIKEQNTKLRDISWYQSHLLRAPLAKIMGIVKLLEDGIISDESEKEFLLKAIYESSTELDKVIHDIVNKT